MENGWNVWSEIDSSFFDDDENDSRLEWPSPSRETETGCLSLGEIINIKYPELIELYNASGFPFPFGKSYDYVHGMIVEINGKLYHVE